MNPPLALGLFGVATMLQCRLTDPPQAAGTAIRHACALARSPARVFRAAFSDRAKVAAGIVVFQPSSPLVLGSPFKSHLFGGRPRA